MHKQKTDQDMLPNATDTRKLKIKNGIWNLPTCICFILFFLINFLTPMHSDDYKYKMMGLDLATHINHYMTWSGRIVADIISPTILGMNNKFLISIIQTGGLFFLIYIITKISYSTIHRSQRAHQGLVFSTLLLCFILFHPAVGQVAFWVVGSANYLWTGILYSIYIYYLLLFEREGKIPWYAFIFAIFSGCTNESAAATLSIASILFLIYSIVKRKQNSTHLLIYVFLFITGALILIASPGNFSRLSLPDSTHFADLTLVQKLNTHINHTLPFVFKNLSFSFIAATFILLINIIFNKNQRKALSLQAIFIGLALASIGSMALSPWFPPRAMTIPLLFTMMSIGTGLTSIIGRITQNATIRASRASAELIVISILLFSLPGFLSLRNQEEVRAIAIKNTHNGEAVIPDFYHPALPLSSFAIDKYNYTPTMAKYYGMDSIQLIEPDFDYGLLLSSDLNTQGYLIHKSNNHSVIVKREGMLLTNMMPRATLGYADNQNIEVNLDKYIDLGISVYYYAKIERPIHTPKSIHFESVKK